MNRPLRVATRGSDLALIQTRLVTDALKRQSDVDCELLIIETHGDRIPDQPLRESEGAGFFTSDIELALITDAADFAVHSLKDLPTASAAELAIAAYPRRAAPGDLLLVRPDIVEASNAPLGLPADARVGTSSNRRRLQLLRLAPRTIPRDIRGNVPTRLEKLRRADYDALILAEAGLQRLNADLSDFKSIPLVAPDFFPAPGQGALAVQCRTSDTSTLKALTLLDDTPTRQCVTAERSLLARVGGGCAAPLGCLVEPVGAAQFRLRAAWFPDDGSYRTCDLTRQFGANLINEAFKRLTP